MCSAKEIKKFLASVDGSGATLSEVVRAIEGCSPSNAATLLKEWAEIGCIRIEGNKRPHRYVWTGKEFPGGPGGKLGQTHHTDKRGLVADLTFVVLKKATKPLSIDKVAANVRTLYLSLVDEQGMRRYDDVGCFKSLVRNQLRRWQRDGAVSGSCWGGETTFSLVSGVEVRPPVRAK